MNRRTQRFIATALIASGALTGLWAGVAFFRASAQAPTAPQPGLDGSTPTDGVQAPAEDPSLRQPAPAPPAPPPANGLPGAPPPPQPGAVPPASPMPGAPPAAAAQDPNMPPPEMPLGDMQGGPQDLEAPDENGGARASTDGFIYNPEGLRDPFFPSRGLQPPAPPSVAPADRPIEDFNVNDPLQKFELREYRLVAVLWDVREPKAMVATPDGKVWTIRQKVRLGRAGAVVAAIRESEIVVVEPNPDGSYVNASTRVISIKK